MHNTLDIITPPLLGIRPPPLVWSGREAPLDIAGGDGRSSASNAPTRAVRELLATFEHVVMMLSMSASKLPLVDRMLSNSHGLTNKKGWEPIGG